MGSKQPSETINQSLRLIAAAELTEQGNKDAPVESCQVEALAMVEALTMEAGAV